MSRRTITVHYVRAALGGARRLGIDTVPLLQGARIPPLLVGDDRARVTPEQFARLVTALRRATGDEFLGLGPAPSRAGTFAMMCYACVACRDLGGALERGTRFYGLFPGGPDLVLERAEGEVVFAVRSDLRGFAEGRFLTECLIVIWHRLASWLIGRRIPLRWAEFAYPAPPYASEYDQLFGCPVRFGARRTGTGFDPRWLAAPLVQDETALEELLRRAPAELLSRREYGTTVAEQVRRSLVLAMRERRAARLPEVAQLASLLAVSPATLRRRLREEGTSYRRLTDQVRQEAAVSSLLEGREPIAELAARLGFSEDTAFHRAFRRWTGTTPGAYRLLEETGRGRPGQQS
ncbi:AraC family transcriptional regulator [Streptomyces eurocidicus]|uniref:AraC family transcriptional regulator n=1 Tax=Streptomyces eurocidicus TaxID=66423 RepID=A0A2N8NS10_STREU|nr:AraC family transcriptional regulator [Streptomyces eurocidicus]MBB5122811.1 AraC-like DNA-binding protein [Streptomyces eurocidicus]MBF6054320.1 helix-turn-helix domain-containing protein [Streptomyces eurocidicus]PNE31557.1 AraC family transcriptional regulator [Streptomyces eurocidicus]